MGTRTAGGGTNNNGNTSSVTRTENYEGCIYKYFEGCKPKPFDGKKGAIDTTQWITKMEAVIKLSECRSDQAVKFAANSLETTTLDWWESNELDKLEEEFQILEAGTMTHHEYATKFDEMSKLVPHLVTPEPRRIKHFIRGLPLKVRTLVKTSAPQAMDAALALSATIYDDVASQEAKKKAKKATDVKPI
ncbi:hypothetical protein L1987_13280 [Smallanthus sonchifolius]|uniref:Uncharacterized protein n=1 Tax=Smallanthus sonchifolius TaxID=185202 RepID=A0ACB9JG35_9ASTR|nr:hypothetical protein L1987_13280 [Smallanthus sonchifolius]